MALCLVFVHGFRGDHTSFQSFPTDLHLHLITTIPQLQTFVYPTYKTTRPLELARDQFLDWMATLPEGRVILCGHSMGGLLTAEVAFAAPPNRVIGLISFDVPYLGVHPHVVLSGIASLLKKKEGRDEAELNDPQHVEMVTKQAGRPYLRETSSSLSTLSLNPAAPTNFTHPSDVRSPTPVAAGLSPPAIPPRRSPSPSPDASSPFPPPPSRSPHIPLPPSLHLSSPRPPVRVISPKIEQAFETFGLGPVPQSVHNVLHFFDKHSGITGIKDWVVQMFEFGGCLLDPQGLIARYEKMQQWGSDGSAGPYGRGWVNFWTITVPKRRGNVNGNSTPRPEEDRESDMATAIDISHMLADQPTDGTDHREHSLSPKPSVSSTDPGSTDLGLLQSTSTTPADTPPTTYAPSEVTQLSRRSDELKGSLEALKAQMADSSISKEDKVELKEKEKELKSTQKALERDEKSIRKEEERQRKEADKQAKKDAKQRQKALDAAAKRAREADKIDSPHHFIVLPRKGTDQQWICVPVAGADSEVTAHCGLFFREENHEYDRLVSDVGNVVRSFWDGAGGTRHLKTPSEIALIGESQ